MKMLRWLALLLLATLPIVGRTVDTPFTTFVTGAPVATAPAGTELIPIIQGAATKSITPTAITTYVNANASLSATAITSGTLSVLRLPAFSGDCSTPGGSGVITCGSNVARTGVDVNTSNQVTATHLAAPLPAAQGGTSNTSLMAAGNALNMRVSVDLIATTNTTLSGSQTIDGVVAVNGWTVLVPSQTGGVNSGFYTVNTGGAWTRWTQVPTGFVVSPGCDFIVTARLGTVNAGMSYWLTTTSTVTFGTTAQTWTVVDDSATATRSGKVTVPAGNSIVASVDNINMQANDCISAEDTLGTMVDSGNAFQGVHGGCMVESLTSGEVLLDGAKPSTSTGAVSANSVQNRVSISGLSAATTVTVTFAHPFTHSDIVCTANDSAGTAVGVVVNSTSSVTFNMVALTGSLFATCW